MSSDKSNNKGKAAVVIKEEPSLVDAESPAMFDDKENWLANKVKKSPSSTAPSQQPVAEGATLPAVATPPAVATTAHIVIFGPQQQHGEDSGSASAKKHIMHCVVALAMWNLVAVNTALECIASYATASGDPLQRVTFLFAEALARRAMRMLLPGLAWRLQLQAQLPPTTTPATANAGRRSFAGLCPLVGVAATATNHAILEATQAEARVHVVDLGGADMSQWLQLVRLFAVRPGGPPSLRLSVVNEQDEFLSHAAGMITQEAVRLHVPFVFNPV